MKVLVIALSGIGDALMFTPALAKLREDKPDAIIDALVMFRGVEEFYSSLPGINKVHFIDFLKGNPLISFFTLLKFFKRYDATINVYPSNRKEYNIISFLIGAKKRIGAEYLHMDKKELGFLNNVRVKESAETHNVVTNIKLVEKFTGISSDTYFPLNFPLTDESKRNAEEFFENSKISKNDLVIGFHPGCNTLKNHINRRWSPDKFANLGKKLIGEKNAKILLFGGPDEESLKNHIAKIIDLQNVFSVSTSSLTASAAVMKRCKLFVTNDSGNMHIAAALKLPVVAIIGPTNPNFIYPWQTKHEIATLNLHCSPCFFYSPKPLTCSRQLEPFKCVRDLNVELVLKHINTLLNESYSS